MNTIKKIFEAPAQVLLISLLSVMLVTGGCSLLKSSSSESGDVQGQPEQLEPIAGRLSQVTGDVAINHQIDSTTPNGNQTAENSDQSQPVAPASAPAGSDNGSGAASAPPTQPSNQYGPPNQPNSAPQYGPSDQPNSAPMEQPNSGQLDQSNPNANPGPQDQAGAENTDWAQASNNMPLTVGDQIYVPDNGRAAVGFSGRKYVRVDPGSTLDVIALSKNDTQLALRSGSAMFDIGELQSGERYEVDTPSGAVDFVKPGLYQIGFNQDGSVDLTVLNGEAQVVSSNGSETVARGQVITLPSADQLQAGAAQPAVADVSPDVCGNIVNDYYSYRYGSAYDGRYADYNTYLTDSTYYDPYQQTASCKYVPDNDYIAGLDDLNNNGDWEPTPDY
ncbi:MAG TPA: FecR domain-containing protein, partial [Blastocatellia bacterium]